jgi:hypothetical protein
LNHGKEKDKSVDNLNDRLDVFDLDDLGERLFDLMPFGRRPPQTDRNEDGRLGIDYWRGKWIIPAHEWMKGTNIYGVLQCFPDKYMPEILNLERFTQCFRLKSVFDSHDPILSEQFQSWKSDYLELYEFRKDPDYGRMKCYDCILSPSQDNGLTMGIFRVLVNSLELEDSPYRSIYPCHVVNRFKCPYDRTIEREYTVTKDNIERKNSIEVNHLFHLEKIAGAVDGALMKAQELGNDSVIFVNSPQDVYDILTNMAALESILDQGLREDAKLCYLNETLKEREKWKEEDKEQYKKTVLDFFASIKDKININDLTVYPRQAVYPS